MKNNKFLKLGALAIAGAITTYAGPGLIIPTIGFIVASVAISKGTFAVIDSAIEFSCNMEEKVVGLIKNHFTEKEDNFIVKNTENVNIMMNRIRENSTPIVSNPRTLVN